MKERDRFLLVGIPKTPRCVNFRDENAMRGNRTGAPTIRKCVGAISGKGNPKALKMDAF